MNPRRVLITGGAGFLGLHLAERFRRHGAAVRLLDVAPAPDWAAGLAVEHVRGDVRDPAAVASAMDGVDAVVHAAFAPPREAPAIIRSVNVEGTRTVVEMARTRGVSRVVLVSSTIVLKPRHVHPLLPNSPLTRLDHYRASRLEAERVGEEHAARGLSLAVAHPKTFVGPARVGAFALLFEAVRLGRPVPVLGAGRNRYQLLDVRDMAEGLRLLAGSRGGGVFCFGAREFGTVREDLQVLLDHARTGARLRFVPARLARVGLRAMELAGIVPLSEWHQATARGQDSMVDISRAERELGWRPARSNARALADAYEWYATTFARSGAARTTQPVPRAHRVLARLASLLPG